jgi:HSP20 family protein
VKKPRQWQYQTRPSFKRVRGPLVDVFNEAEEVLIVVDMGGFTRGEISLNMTPEHYILQARRGEQLFRELIALPPNVDVAHSQERLINGVLEIILPRKNSPVPSRKRIPRRR